MKRQGEKAIHPIHDQVLEFIRNPAAAACPLVRAGRRREVDGRIVGSLTLVMFRIPTGLRAWIEDVVVDAFDSLCRGVQAGRFPNLDDRDDLWQVLMLLTRVQGLALQRFLLQLLQMQELMQAQPQMQQQKLPQ